MDSAVKCYRFNNPQNPLNLLFHVCCWHLVPGKQDHSKSLSWAFLTLLGPAHFCQIMFFKAHFWTYSPAQKKPTTHFQCTMKKLLKEMILHGCKSCELIGCRESGLSHLTCWSVKNTMYLLMQWTRKYNTPLWVFLKTEPESNWTFTWTLSLQEILKKGEQVKHHHKSLDQNVEHFIYRTNVLGKLMTWTK